MFKYAIVIVLTFLLSITIVKLSTKKNIKSSNNIVYSQSTIHQRIRPFIANSVEKESKIVSQSMQHIQRNMVKIIVIDNKAYWVKDNIFYTAETNDGTVIYETVQPVDTQDMSKTDIDKMLFILDNLDKENKKNDSSSSGN